MALYPGVESPAAHPTGWLGHQSQQWPHRKQPPDWVQCLTRISKGRWHSPLGCLSVCVGCLDLLPQHNGDGALGRVYGSITQKSMLGPKLQKVSLKSFCSPLFFFFFLQGEVGDRGLPGPPPYIPHPSLAKGLYATSLSWECAFSSVRGTESWAQVQETWTFKEDLSK